MDEQIEIERLLGELEKALRIEPADVPIEPRLRNALGKGRLLALDVAVVEKENQRYEKRYRTEFAGGFVFRVTGMLQHLDNQCAGRAAAFDGLRERVLEHLLGVRVLVNMVLNGDWTHAQKNHTIQALGELTETGIHKLREDREHDWLGSDSDIFAPTWSLRGQMRRAQQAEEELAKLRSAIAQGDFRADGGTIHSEGESWSDLGG